MCVSRLIYQRETVVCKSSVKSKFDSGNGIVKIDVSKLLTESIVDVSQGISGASSRVNNYAKFYEEVLIRGLIPPESITVL